MNLTFRQLHAFIIAARLGSFTRAAEEIHVSQAGLSLMIKELEDQLGYRLFDRTTRSVWLTDAGTKFLPVVSRALQEIDAAAQQLSRAEEQAQHLLSVAATPLVCGTILPGVIQRLQETHPYIRLTVRDVERPALQSVVSSGEVDLGVGILVKAASGIVRHAVHELSLVCVASGDTQLKPLRRRAAKCVSWAELSDAPLIGLPAENPIQQLINRELKETGQQNASKLTFENMLTIIGMVEAGLGLAILPSFVKAACLRYNVQVCELEAPRVPLDFYAITKQGTVTPPTVPVFVEALQKQLLGIEDSFH